MLPSALALSFALAALPPLSGPAPGTSAWPFGPPALVPNPRTESVRSGWEDIFVVPSRPGQNRVQYWDWDWKVANVYSDRGGGAIQLFYYPREREASEYAAAILRTQYLKLIERTHYLPRSPFAFVLYASYSEFQATNVFEIGEGTLGVTDPTDLRMAMPFFGDLKEFERVSTHEMAHQFTIQKVRDAAAAARTSNPLYEMPLWFIEGIAEYLTFEGIDPEGDYLLRDLILNPSGREGWVLPPFFDGAAGGYIGVYKLGQAKCTFLSETYGKEAIIDILERSPALARGAPTQSNRPMTPPPSPGESAGSFAQFVAMVVGDSPETIDAKYQNWFKTRYYRAYLEAHQRLAEMGRLHSLQGEPDSFSIDDAGQLILYRTVERETGLSTLHLQDLGDPQSHLELVTDQRPGVESLHPVERRVTAIRGNTLVYLARTGKRDTLFVQPIEVEQQEGRRRLKTGALEKYLPDELYELYDPALSPDGSEVAFVGIDPGGFRDLYRMALRGPEKGKIKRLTHSSWSKADVAWDGDRLIYVSDQTESRESNLYALDLKTLEASRLSFSNVEERGPTPALGGIVYRSLLKGKPDLYLLKDGASQRLTDTASALLWAQPARSGGLWILAFQSGRHGVYRLNPNEMLHEPAAPPAMGGSGASIALNLPYPRFDLPPVEPYDPFSSKNWRIEGQAAAAVGTYSVGAAGMVVTDLLRDHLLLVNLAIYGDLRLTDALALYINQTGRFELGGGFFHTFEPRRDKTFPDTLNYYLERSFGAVGLARYPINRFERIEASVEAAGVSRFDFTDQTGTLNDAWKLLNSGVDPEFLASASYGYDATRLHAYAGPIGGVSFLGSVGMGYLPTRDFAFVRAMTDLQYRLQIYGRTNLLLRAALGASSGGRFSPQYYLFAVGNLEGFHLGDIRLLGDNYAVANARLTLPIDWLIQLPFVTGIYAIGGADFGGVFDHYPDAWENRSLSAVTGADVALGALVLQFHVGKLIDVGGAIKSEPWAFNFSLRYLYQ